MARNEEKQLARLNRFYLEKQKQEELKKRPPRPRLDTLNTSRELRKWLPTITQDIEFYVKQMEVTCYTDAKIEEFEGRIQRLKQEYRAYMHKLRTLEPDIKPSSWADRPYATRKRHADTNQAQENVKETSFVPLLTPVLHNMPSKVNPFTLDTPTTPTWNVNPLTQDQPLVFASTTPLSLTDGGDARTCVRPLSIAGTESRTFSEALPISTTDTKTCGSDIDASKNGLGVAGTRHTCPASNDQPLKFDSAWTGSCGQLTSSDRTGGDSDALEFASGIYSVKTLGACSVGTASSDSDPLIKDQCLQFLPAATCSGKSSPQLKHHNLQSSPSDVLVTCDHTNKTKFDNKEYNNPPVSSSNQADSSADKTKFDIIKCNKPSILSTKPANHGNHLSLEMSSTTSDSVAEAEASQSGFKSLNPLNLDYSDSSDDDS